MFSAFELETRNFTWMNVKHKQYNFHIVKEVFETFPKKS